jgi:drug/metabolite transporter (DMT)-like permease
MSRSPAPGGPAADPAAAKLLAAFAAIYIIWGSTYLAIRIAIESIPPFLMAGVRFTTAGLLLLAWARARGAGRVSRRQWLHGTLVGGLLLLGGNGAVVWAEQWVPSGVVAVLVATVPLWMVLVDWLWAGSRRPRLDAWVGLGAGLVGVWVLVGAGGLAALDGPVRVGALVVVGGAISWAFGSILSRELDTPASPRLATAVQMLTGGLLLLLAGAVTGEMGALHLSEVTARSLAALGYLIVFGGIVAYGAYVWLLRVAPPAQVSTYAYVNPVVALFLGWAVAGEPVTPRTLLGAGIIIGAVVVMGRVGQRARRREARAAASAGPSISAGAGPRGPTGR